MLEPITLSLVAQSLATSQLISSVIGGWLGNRSDHYLCKAGQVVYEHLKNQSEPVNHDIQRAVREAYLRATLMACERLLYQKYNWIDRRFHLPTYDLKEIISYLKKQRRQLDRANFSKQINPANADYLLLLEPSGRPSHERISELKQQLRETLLHELDNANLYVEDDLKAAILTGWIDEGKSVDWYELMCAFFAEILKTNSRLSTIVQTNLLRDLKAQVPDVPWPDELLEQQAALIGEAVQPLVNRFDEVMARLDDLLELLGEVRDGVTQANEKLDTLLGRPAIPTRAKYLNTFARYDLQNLVGREQQLQDIDAHLAKHNLLLLRGMGGIGKTTLARAYLARMEAQFDHVAFVEITSTIADGMLLTLGGSTDVDFTPDPAKDTEAKFNELLEVLRHIPNTLLVIDNANDNEDLLHRKKAFDTLPWKVLITSRVCISEFVQAQQELEIGAFLPDEARQLFERYIERPLRQDETEVVDDMLEKAFYNAKLVKVIATLIRRKSYSFLDLTTFKTIVEKRSHENQIINYPANIDEQEKPIYRILLDLFYTDRLSNEDKKLLRYFAVLPSATISVLHLAALLQVESSAEQKMLLTGLNNLVRAGWLDETDSRSFLMHALVQWIMSERLQPTSENCSVLLTGMANALYYELTDNPFEEQLYSPYKTQRLTFFANDKQELLATVYDNLAGIYQSWGQNVQRLTYYQKALVIREAVSPPDYPKLAHSYDYLALAHMTLGDTEQAAAHAHKAINIQRTMLPANHPDLATSYSILATIYGRNDQGLYFDMKALRIRESVLPPDHLDLAQSYNSIAITCYYFGFSDSKFFNSALGYIQKAISIREHILTPTHPDLLSSRKSSEIIEQAIREQNNKPG